MNEKFYLPMKEHLRWQKPTNCLSVFDHFVGLTLARVNKLFRYLHQQNIRARDAQSHIENSAKHQKWSVLQKNSYG